MAQDDYIRTALRVPPELHKQLHAAAVARGRSFNAEIIGRLYESFEEDATVQHILSGLAQPDDHQRMVLDAIEQLRHEVSQLRGQLKRGK